MAQHRTSHNLVEVTGFGSNPGALRCWLYLPTILAPKTPLVVVLHGCTQSAEGFAHGSGWTQLAEAKGFAVLFPEQRRENNGNLCFNWFEPGDTRRGSGEALSIHEMISHTVLSHGMDPQRVFITGLSAGGAMANVMLATYPDDFAAGAVIAGLPYGVASNVPQAFERMKGRNPPSRRNLRSAMIEASPTGAGRPKISIWHGTHDQVVRPMNAEQIAAQWIGVLGISEEPGRIESIGDHARREWLDADGVTAVELYMVKGMGHGVPLSSGASDPLGNTGPFMLESGISSTARIARTWGLADDADVTAAEGPLKRSASQPATDGVEAVIAKAMSYAKVRISAKSADQRQGVKGVGDVINDALRAAGLMR